MKRFLHLNEEEMLEIQAFLFKVSQVNHNCWIVATSIEYTEARERKKR